MTASATSAMYLQIRKYPNRRYYDSTHSRHVTLEQIFALIRQGHEINVVDSKTGKDITAKVLAQIIIELDAPKLGVFPVAMLHRLLQSNTALVGDFIDKYFNRPLQAFMNSQRSMGDHFRQALGYPGAPASAEEWLRMMWSPFSSASEQGAHPKAPTADGSPKASEPDIHVEIESLRRQLTELRSRVPSPAAAPVKSRRKRAS